MELFYRKIGEGQPLIILHGVFGSGDNLYTISKSLAENGYEIYLTDARNHGQSPRSEEFDYEVMAADLNELIEKENLNQPIIMGHSMGGKTVMQYSQLYDNFKKLIIVDIAPRYYPTHHNHIINGLNAIDLTTIKSRKDAEEIFSQYVKDFGEQQFILKNLYRTSDGFDWRINVPVIAKNIYQVGAEISLDKKIDKPVLFIKGGDSAYINQDDEISIKNCFINAAIVSIPGANHWVHATQPEEFLNKLLAFMQD